MVDNKSNWIIDICNEIIFMLNNNQFYYTNNTKYNSLIVKLFKDYINFIDSYNNQEENPERLFDNYNTQEELIALEVFKALLRDSSEFMGIDANNPDDIALLEKSFNQIALNLDKTTSVQTVQTYNPTHLPMTSIPTHANNKKIIKVNEKWLNDLTLISQQQKRIEFEQNCLYQKDIDTKNRIVKNHIRTVNLLANQDLIIWKDQSNKLYYTQKAFEKEQKISKNEMGDITSFHTKVYDSTNDVQVVDADYIIVSLLPTVRKNIFNPFSNNEFIRISNNLYDRNQFEYTNLLEKRFYPLRIDQLHQEINDMKQRLYYRNTYNIHNMFNNQINDKDNELQWLKNSLVVKDKGFIEKLLKLIFQNEEEFYFFLFWLSNFFWTLNKSNIAVVLIGDSETTNIIVDYIIKPIFIKNKKYICTINNESLKNNDNDKLITDKMFYHIDNFSNITDSKRVSKLLRNIIKPNYINSTQAWDADESYIYGEILITSEKENPYGFLKSIFSSCTVLRIKSMDTILNKLDMEYSQFDKCIADDLNNFVNKLVQYGQNNRFFGVLNTDEKSYLHTMKNGVLITPTIDRKIDYFVENMLSKNTSAFELIKEHDKEMYEEFLSNFNEDMIAQPLLSTYFNIINNDMLIPDNVEFIKILQTKADMFKEALNDKSKSNGKKRYKIFR